MSESDALRREVMATIQQSFTRQSLLIIGAVFIGFIFATIAVVVGIKICPRSGPDGPR